MSLVSLTFGSGKAQSVSQVKMFVQRPLSHLKVNPQEENLVEIIKTSQFFGHDDVYVIAEVVSGVLLQDMKVNVAGKVCSIREVESKLGKTNAKKGMVVGFYIDGVDKETVQTGQKLTLVA